MACYQGYVDVVIALSQCPYVDVNWQDNEGNTALMTAAQAGKGSDSNSSIKCNKITINNSQYSPSNRSSERSFSQYYDISRWKRLLKKIVRQCLGLVWWLLIGWQIWMWACKKGSKWLESGIHWKIQFKNTWIRKKNPLFKEWMKHQVYWISQTCSSKQTPSNLSEGHLQKSTFRWLDQVNTVYIVSVFL